MATTHRVMYEALKKAYPVNEEYKMHYRIFCKVISPSLVAINEQDTPPSIIQWCCFWLLEEEGLGLPRGYFREVESKLLRVS
jgi:hypothetical protein